MVGSEVMLDGQWYSVAERPGDIIAALRSSDSEDMIRLTALRTGTELWLRAGRIEAVAGLVFEDDEDFDAGDDVFDQVLSELEADGLELITRPTCEKRGRRLIPRLRGDR